MESETKLAMAVRWSECSAERGSTGDPDDGGVGSRSKEPLTWILEFKIISWHQVQDGRVGHRKYTSSTQRAIPPEQQSREGPHRER